MKQSTEQIKLAVIGCGEHSRENLVPSLCDLNDAYVVAVCDTDSKAAKEVAWRFACDTEPTFADAICRNDVDAVVIAATPQVHLAAARMALERGLHVFVEKPPTVTSAELKELVTLARGKRLVTCVGHNLRHATAAIEMQSVIAHRPEQNPYESFGHPLAMEMRYFASKPKGDRWGLNSSLRSFLLSHANHAIDFMIYQMGPIEKVNAALASPSEDHRGIAMSAQFIFQSGAVGNLLATSFAPHFSISGTIVSDMNRVVHLNSLHEVIAYGLNDDKKRWGRQWISKTLLTGYEAAGYLTELKHFVEAVRDGAPEKCQPSFADEIAVYDAMDQISAKIKNALPMMPKVTSVAAGSY